MTSGGDCTAVPAASFSTSPPTSADSGQSCCVECCEGRLHSLGRSLLKAVDDGRTQEVRKLLEQGAEVNFTYESEWTPLLRASARANAEVVALLLNRGANYNAKTCCGFTALHMAACKDHSGRCIYLLLNAGTYVDICNEFRRTPLHYASECSNEAAIRALVAAGANKSAKDDNGNTPIDIAKTTYIRKLLRRI